MRISDWSSDVCSSDLADFGHFPALKSPRRGGQRMNPEIGFACSCRMLNQSRIVERRRLIGHQRRAGNAAELESRLVGLEHAEVNNAWSNQQAAKIRRASCRERVGQNV